MMDYREFLGEDYDISGLSKADIELLIEKRIIEISECLKDTLLCQATPAEREQVFYEVTGEPNKFDIDILFGSLDDLTLEEYDENLKTIETAMCDLNLI